MTDKNSTLEQLKKLDDERAKIFGQAKQEALAAAKEAVSALNALGLRYQLVERYGTAPKITRRRRKDAPCPICKFKTSPPHDRRAHRSQRRKTPLTKQELARLGYARA